MIIGETYTFDGAEVLCFKSGFSDRSRSNYNRERISEDTELIHRGGFECNFKIGVIPL